MKWLLAVLLSLVLFQPAADAQQMTIGYRDEMVFSITADLEKIEAEWEAFLHEHAMKAELSDWKITSNMDGETEYQMLVAREDRSNIRIASLLMQDGNKLSLPTSGGKTARLIVCQGCPEGCNPAFTKEGPFCTDCGSTVGCKKVTSVFAAE